MSNIKDKQHKFNPLIFIKCSFFLGGIEPAGTPTLAPVIELFKIQGGTASQSSQVGFYAALRAIDNRESTSSWTNTGPDECFSLQFDQVYNIKKIRLLFGGPTNMDIFVGFSNNQPGSNKLCGTTDPSFRRPDTSYPKNYQEFSCSLNGDFIYITFKSGFQDSSYIRIYEMEVYEGRIIL